MSEHTRRRGAERAGVAVPAPPLVERDDALASLASALDATVAGAGRAIVVAGEAGSGKSRILAESIRLGRDRELAVLFARATELERGYGFGVVRRLLERRLAALDAGELASLRASAAGPALDLIAEGGVAAPPADALATLVHSTYRLCARLADAEPLLVVVDDLHWADAASVHALAYLASRIEDLPIALVLAIRSGEPLAGPDPRDAVTESAAVVGVTVRPLSTDGSARLLGSLLGSVSPEFAIAAHDATAGNPFLLTELARTFAREGIEADAAGAQRITGTVPDAIRGWASRRFAAMSESAQALARSLAILEQSELAVAAEHAGLRPAVAREAADQLAVAALVEAGLPLRFVHPLIRAALYEDVPPASCDEAHHEAARLLAARGAADEAVAAHLLEAEPRGEEWAVRALRSAAAAALARGSADAAAKLLARAAAEPQADTDPILLIELGRARAAINDPGAIGDLERAAAQASEPATRIEALAALAQARYLAGEVTAAFASAGEALAAIPPGAGGAAEAELLLGYLMAGRQSPQLLEPTREMLARERPESSPGEIVRRQVVGLDAYLRGERELAASSSRWVAARLAEQQRGAELPPLLAIGPSFVLSGLGAWEAAERVIATALERAHARGSPLETAECLHERIWHRWRRGDVIGALGDVQTVRELTAGAWDPAKVPMRVAEALLLVERGEVDAAARALALPAELERVLPGTWGWPWLALGRGVIALLRGDEQSALAQALAAGERLERIDAPSPEYAPWRSVAARAAAACGDPERALVLARSECSLGARIGAPRALGTGLMALAVLGPEAERVDVLRRACAALDEARCDLLRGHARLELGMALRRARHPRDAREPLREALDIGQRIGAVVVAERALAELRAAGSRPRRRRVTGVASLTPREREIAALAAEGLGNVEIAERLFITRKTVEGHLRTVFRKLEISSRDQIGAALPS